MNDTKPRIYAFVNGRIRFGSSTGQDDYKVVALAEDGTCLAGHLSSTLYFARHDIGCDDSEWHHEAYREHYPDGFVVEWVDESQIDGHPGLQKALAIANSAAPQREGEKP